MNANQMKEGGWLFSASGGLTSRHYPPQDPTTTTANNNNNKTTTTNLNNKWGEHVMAQGYTAVPDILLKRMGALGLTPTDLVVLLQLLRYWWTADQLPFPSKRSLAQAMGCSEKNVQKVMKSLEARGFVERIKRRREADRNESNIYNLYPLVDRLREMVAQDEQALKRGDIRRRNQVNAESGVTSVPVHAICLDEPPDRPSI